MEETLIRNKLEKMPGVTGLEFNLLKRVLTVRHELESLDQVEKALHSIDMKPVLLADSDEFCENIPVRFPWVRLSIAGTLALGAEVAHFIDAVPYLALVLALAAICVGGLSTYKKGWIAIKNLNINMNALMSLAVTGAMIIGQWPEAAMVMVLFSAAEAIEAKSLAKARDAIGGLLKLTPEKATVWQADGSWGEMEATAVTVGSRVRVKPGERVALDGQIVNGSSSLNQASITGESLPVEKTVGDQIFAGTVNESGSFEYEVQNAFCNSTLSRIIRAVEDAQATRAPVQRLVDQFARIYTPIVLAVAVLVGVLPPLLMEGAEWLGREGWIYKGLVFLVIACPCALVISTPVTIVSGLAAATRHGLLIKGGAFLELGRKLKCLMLDKTGTVTTGRPIQTDMLFLGDVAEAEVRQAALSLAARSDHPVSRAIVQAATKEGLTATLEVEDFKSIPGQGISGTIEGHQWQLGNHRLIHDCGFCSPGLEQQIDRWESQGKSVVGVMDGQKAVMLLAVADTIRASSAKAITDLKQLGLTIMMLTGDNQKTAETVARQAGVDEFRGELMPEDKLAVVTEFAEKGCIVGMVGDGINDAPALAKAHIGFAMGAAGTDTAIETADVALMTDDLGKLPIFIKLSQDTYRILMQNITLAIGIKLIFFVLTFFGYASMWMAVFADIGVSLIVVFNGMRMLRR